jgi:predicted nucleic acid-binding protein
MKRLRIVLDTNVIIYGILFGGIPRSILDMLISGGSYKGIKILSPRQFIFMTNS